MTHFFSSLLALWLIVSAGLAQEIVISFGGDVNFARSRETPDPVWVRKFGTLRIEETTAGLAPYWDADLNIVNVETVVSDRNGASSATKAFVFRSHPESFRHLMELGVNGFALANNHAYDHGFQGMADTLGFFAAEAARREIAFAGIGAGDAAFAPSIVTLRGVRIAFASASFGSGAFGPEYGPVGMAYLSVPSHYDRVLAGLREADADLRILALHYGTENMNALNPGQRAMFRRGLEEAGVNLVIGHHPHVVRGVEADPAAGQAVFYSMGNLLFVGGAEKDSAPLGMDYGLLGRAYFQKTAQGWRITALEAVPLKGVHFTPAPPPPERVARTIDHLNRLSEASVGPGAAVRFTPVEGRGDRGAACYGSGWGPRAQALCCAFARGPNPSCDLPDPM
ncbi:CapA family protein [Pseudogemmobacter sonorensis]|uniref:CapA family protein n=1 Tax=Pseudogemmobacter sonorensis TaxID=2989681 RepID=UPI0036A2B3CA